MTELCARYRLLLGQFKEYLAAQGFSGRTVSDYPVDVEPFLMYLEQECKVTDMNDVESSHIQCYHGVLMEKTFSGRPLKTSTRHLMLRRVKSFLKFLHTTGKIQKDPGANVALPKVRKNPPRNILEVSEVVGLMEQPDLKSPIGIRDRAMLELLYSSALRNSELRHLECCDVDMEQRIVHVHGKGGSYDIVPFGSEAASALNNYLHFSRPLLIKRYKMGSKGWRSVSVQRIKKEQGRDYVFLSRSGCVLSSHDLQRIVRDYAGKIGKDITPHCLRHSCATHLLRNGADIRYIQRLLRHRDINSTQVYTRVVIEDLKTAHKKYHPRERDIHA